VLTMVQSRRSWPYGKLYFTVAWCAHYCCKHAGPLDEEDWETLPAKKRDRAKANASVLEEMLPDLEFFDMAESSRNRMLRNLVEIKRAFFTYANTIPVTRGKPKGPTPPLALADDLNELFQTELGGALDRTACAFINAAFPPNSPPNRRKPTTAASLRSRRSHLSKR